MTRTGPIAAMLAAALLLLCAGTAGAQAPGQYGARVGNTYIPSSHDAGCTGLICSSVPADPTHPSQALPAPPCGGLLCDLTPYSMQQPHTAAEAAAVERQRAAEAAAAPPPAPPAPARHARRHHAKVRAAAAAPRTPAPAEPAQ